MASHLSDPRFDRLLRQPHVEALAAAARSTGAEAHLVGGALRDCWLRLAVKDLDAVVAGHGLEIARQLSRLLSAKLVRLGGERFAALRLVGADFTLDIWDRFGNQQEQSLGEDLARRDLTVNAMALDLANGRLSDPFGGREDLARRRLRAVTDESFSADPLRVLRLPRFALQLAGFGPDHHTLQLARDAAPALHRVAVERIRDELGKIFRLAGTQRALTLLHQLDLYPALWLGQTATGEVQVDQPRTLHRATRPLERIPEAARRLQTLGLDEPTQSELAATRLALSFRALAPEANPAAQLEAFRKAGYLSRTEAANVAPLLHLPQPPRSKLDRRTFLHQSAEHQRPALLLTVAEALATPERPPWTEQPLADLVRLARQEGDQLAHPPRLLDGHEVQQLLGATGKQIGQALKEIERAWVEGQVTSKAEARAWLLRARAAS